MAALSAVDVVDELAAFLGRDAPQRNPIGALTIHVSVVEAVVLGLASNSLSFCIFLGEDSILEVGLDLVDPTSVLAYQGHQQVSAQWKLGYHGPARQGPRHSSEDFAKDQALQAW